MSSRKVGSNGFTVNQLHKRLGELVDAGDGRKYVAIDKASFTDNRESDGVRILNVHGIGLLCVNIADDDGGTAFNRDGTEKQQRMCVLVGSDRATTNGEICESEAVQ